MDHSYQLPHSGFCHHMFCDFLGPTRTIFSPRTIRDHLPLLRVHNSVTSARSSFSFQGWKPTTLSTGPSNGRSSPEHPAFINSANTARAACVTMHTQPRKKTQFRQLAQNRTAREKWQGSERLPGGGGEKCAPPVATSQRPWWGQMFAQSENTFHICTWLSKEQRHHRVTNSMSHTHSREPLTRIQACLISGMSQLFVVLA